MRPRPTIIFSLETNVFYKVDWTKNSLKKRNISFITILLVVCTSVIYLNTTYNSNNPLNLINKEDEIDNRIPISPKSSGLTVQFDWEQIWGYSSICDAYELELDSQGNAYITGSDNNDNLILLKYNSSGDKI